MDAIALAFEEAHDARQHVIVAADAEAEQEGQILDGAEIEPDIGEIRPRDRADDDEIAAALVLERGEQLADLAPFQPGVREAVDLLVGLAANAENMHARGLAPSRLRQACREARRCRR